ncbi:MAG: OadG family protein [Bacteroidales bacterium]|nr:OadG family protein [Bacteroidales bacterium]
MKTIYKMLLAGLLSCTMLTAVAQEQPEPRPEGCPMNLMAPTVDFVSVKTCYVPQMGAFVAVDSVECSVHLVAVVDDQRLDTVGCFKTDNTHKRHDLKNILRPVSVSALGDYIIVLASAVNDTAYVAILDRDMNELARRSFNSPMYAMHIAPGKIFIVGRNPYGYDINIIPIEDCPVKAFAEGEMLSHHYRVAKQAEKIKHSDPAGIGLAAVAVAVVFLALVCIFLLISGSGKLITSTEERRKKKEAQPKSGKGIKPVSEGSSTQNMEVYAAIAAAIHLYNDELHDEENTVITIQKVEREWTPWNAKYYNMNHYFNNRR